MDLQKSVVPGKPDEPTVIQNIEKIPREKIVNVTREPIKAGYRITRGNFKIIIGSLEKSADSPIFLGTI